MDGDAHIPSTMEEKAAAGAAPSLEEGTERASKRALLNDGTAAATKVDELASNDAEDGEAVEEDDEGAPEGEEEEEGKGEEEGEGEGVDEEKRKAEEALLSPEERARREEARKMKEMYGKKKKVALFLGYLGVGYSGMQRQPHALSIEEVLEKAVVKAGGIMPENAGVFHTVSWMRAARTDKNVSAVANVVSLQMHVEPPGIVERINANLPDHIRVYGYKRTTQGFDARKWCETRRYEYALPLFALDPDCCRDRSYYERPDVRARLYTKPETLPDASAPLQDEPEAEGADWGDNRYDPLLAPATAPRTYSEEDLIEVEVEGERRKVPWFAQYTGSVSFPPKSTLQWSENLKARLNGVLQRYHGTKNFSNFTVDVDPYSMQAKRFIKEFHVKDMVEVGGVPYVRLTVLGASFMMHQIRKMVGTALAVMRGACTAESLGLALEGTKRVVETPMAPGVGLLLEECLYDGYNQRWAGAGSHEALNFDEYKDQMEAIKMTHIYPEMVREDTRGKHFCEFLRYLTDRKWGFSTWGDGSKWPAPPRRAEKPQSSRGYKGKNPAGGRGGGDGGNGGRGGGGRGGGGRGGGRGGRGRGRK